MEHFSEMTPLFGHANLGEEHLSPHMRAYVASSGMSVSTHSSLVGANRAEGMLLHSELLRSWRQGASDPSLAPHANMAKLSVKSVYGKTITNKENHKM